MELTVLGHLQMPTLNDVASFSEDAEKSVSKHAGLPEEERDQAVGADVLKSENLKEYYAFCCDAVILSCVDPIVTKDGSNGSVCIDDINSNDKMFIGSQVFDQEGENALKRFFKNDNQVLILDSVARAYGSRPSEIIGGFNNIQAFDFDAAVYYRSTILNKTDEKGNPVNRKYDPNEAKKIEDQGYAKLRTMMGSNK